MTHQAIEISHSFTKAVPDLSNSSVWRTAYNLAAVFALMFADGLVSSAYQPSDGAAFNATHAPTAFRGAPPAK